MSEENLEILVVDDEPHQREMLSGYLEDRGHGVRVAHSAESALDALKGRAADLVLTDLRLPGKDGIDFLRAARGQGSEADFLVMTAFGTVANAVEAMRAGAYDYLTKPLRLDELDAVIARVAERRRLLLENRRLRRELQESDDLAGLGPAMQQVCELADRVAPSDATILIAGESGVGKELVANRIHAKSRRALGPLLKINCAALPDSLLESELFGHEKGAFTGADTSRRGLFESAAKGTVFLDEIGDISSALQVRLLRVLQEREIMRLGSSKALPVDARIVAATNRDLEAAVASGTFRKDLFFRLRVIEIPVPPLRERPEDIPVLAEKLLRRHAARDDVPCLPLAPAALAALMRHPFPGNVRELENMLERALLVAREDSIEPGDLALDLPASDSSGEDANTLPGAVAALEKSWIRRALADADGVRAQAARLLGIPDRVLRYKIKKYGLGRDPG